jgi:hypothetical protein
MVKQFAPSIMIIAMGMAGAIAGSFIVRVPSLSDAKFRILAATTASANVFPAPNAPLAISRLLAWHSAGRLQIGHASRQDWIASLQNRSIPSWLQTSLQEAPGLWSIPFVEPLS